MIEPNWIFAADLHLSANTPRFRKDDYPMVGLRKLEFLLQTAEERGAMLGIAGDVFDKSSGPIWFLNAIINLLLRYPNVRVFCVSGNHDQAFHQLDLQRSQLGTLIEAGLIKLVSPVEYFGGVNLYGRSWGEEYPVPGDTGINILMAHETVTEHTPPPWLSAVTAMEMIDSHPGFDFIITGDFHEKFKITYKGCTLVNTGPMLRASIDKKDFKPSCWWIKGKEVTEVPIPIEEGVFDLSGIVEAARIKESVDNSLLLERFVLSMDFSGTSRPTFSQIVTKGVDELGEDKSELKLFIQGVMDHVRED